MILALVRGLLDVERWRLERRIRRGRVDRVLSAQLDRVISALEESAG